MRNIKFTIILLLGQTITAIADQRLTVHQAPRPLPVDATTEAWPRFLGLRDNATSLESGIATTWTDGGPPLVWEVTKGDGYTTPAIAESRLVLFHRWQDKETIECRDPESGALQWLVDYPITYRDRYGYSNGPRGSPVINGNHVYTFGVTARLTCIDLAAGKQLWQRDLKKDYQVPQYFFGSGSSPLVMGDLLVVNAGGGDAPEQDRPTVIAFDKKTGKTRWITKHAWGASYASPIATTFHGKKRLLIFAGGKSRPTIGGLMLINPKDGAIIDTFDWRAAKFESVNATTPLVHGNRIFLTETYRKGGVALDVGQEPEKFSVAWEAPDLAIHWSMPVYHEGHVYGFHGEREPFAELVCYDWATGKCQWRDEMRWTETINGRSMINSPFRGSLLYVANQFLCLREGGSLLWLDLSPKGAKTLQRTQLFNATQTWSTPAIHRGLVYISQHYQDLRGKTKPRLLCYDFRSATPTTKP